MREIKFRAWDKLNYRFLSMPLVGIDFENDCVNSYEIEQISDTEYKTVQNVCYSYELMQYTGLKDKNRVEIYEGDILSHHLQGNRFVEYGSPFKDYGGYMLVSKNGMRGTLNNSDKLYEVIGNIYENPELLEKGNELC